jgi:hypothetical protein
MSVHTVLMKSIEIQTTFYRNCNQQTSLKSCVLTRFGELMANSEFGRFQKTEFSMLEKRF